MPCDAPTAGEWSSSGAWGAGRGVVLAQGWGEGCATAGDPGTVKWLETHPQEKES